MSFLMEEKEIMTALEALTARKGFIHVVAYFAFFYEFMGNDAEHLPTRNGIMLLLGLMAKHPIDTRLPSVFESEEMKEEALELLHRLTHIHGLMMNELRVNYPEDYMMRAEYYVVPIFYNPPGVFDLQYIDFAPKRYQKDDAWLLEHKGFESADMAELEKFFTFFLSPSRKRFLKRLERLNAQNIQTLTFLPAFTFNKKELGKRFSKAQVERILNLFDAFALDMNRGTYNAEFDSINVKNALLETPILKVGQDYFIFDFFTLFEALYTRPFDWMIADNTYRNEAASHRGRFTESMLNRAFSNVFGRENVYQNVEIIGRDDVGNDVDLGEIDLLVLWEGRAIVVQAKSQRLTDKARLGDEKSFKRDFFRAVQKSYQQGVSCYQHLTSVRNRLQIAGEPLEIPAIDEVYLVCAVSDYFPTLSSLAEVFLRVEEGNLYPSLVSDLFFVDFLCEVIESPEQFFAYMDQRASFEGKLYQPHELYFLAAFMAGVTEALLETPTDSPLLFETSGVELTQRFYQRYAKAGRIPDYFLE
ncbi:MAG: hypothetical protein GX667_06200 [Xanthomonadaceae bacterium]|nr:hypothetical protein [Xanthomonadaceae bacterium]